MYLHSKVVTFDALDEHIVIIQLLSLAQEGEIN